MAPRHAILILVTALLLGTPAVVQAQNPDLHNEGAQTGEIIESPEAIKVTGVIQCFCGTCVNQTLHECSCGLAAMERRKVAAALAAGATPEQLIAQYVRDQGPQVRIVPERRGLNLIGWAVPFAASFVGLLALSLVLLGWQRKSALIAREAGAAASGAPAPAEAEYRKRLERELKEFD